MPSLAMLLPLLILLLLGITIQQNVAAMALVHTERVLDSAAIIRPASAPTSRYQRGEQATLAKGWTLFNANRSIQVPATVPGSVHLDLMSSEVLNKGDPFSGFNELRYAWVALSDWSYCLTLPSEYWLPDWPTSPDDDDTRRQERPAVGLLTFEAIDTFATVRVNGHEVGSSSNHFMPSTFVIKGDALKELLQSEVLIVEVTISSALRRARDRAAHSGKDVPDMLFYQDWAEPVHRNFARKAASDFGWDWGPAFVPAGLPGSVSLTFTNVGRLLPDVSIAQDWRALLPRVFGPPDRKDDRESDSVVVTATALLDGFEENQLPLSRNSRIDNFERDSVDVRLAGHVHFSLAEPAEHGGGVVTDACVRVELPGRRGIHNATEIFPVQANLTVTSPYLWWPRGLGSQSLYTLQIDWYPMGSDGERTEPCSRGNAPQTLDITGDHQHVRLKIGLRHVSLVREAFSVGGDEGSEAGLLRETFFFRVNGVEVFARGSNWVPPDAWGQRVTEVKRRWLLESAAAANMNMIRVWGGGRRQPRSFYSACDEMGLMVWQDMPYACALYPVEGSDNDNPASYGNGDGYPASDGLTVKSATETDNQSEKGRLSDEFTDSPRAVFMGVFGGRSVASELSRESRVRLTHKPEGGFEGERGTGLLEAAADEAKTFVRRLSAHPSVVCWGGNNEVEQALGWFNVSSGAGKESYRRDYIRLFVTAIGEAVRSVDPYTPFVDSSPSNGYYDVTTPRQPDIWRNSDGHVTQQHNSLDAKPTTTGELGHRIDDRKRWGDPNDPDFGDVHFYDYEMDCEDAEAYPRAMFVSEHGVQSFPSIKSYRQVIEPEDRWLASPAFTFRQRHEGGDVQIAAQIRRHFRTPSMDDWLNAGGKDEGALAAYLLLSQIQQGRCLETAIGQWRRLRPNSSSSRLNRNKSQTSSSSSSSSREDAKPDTSIVSPTDSITGPDFLTLDEKIPAFSAYTVPDFVEEVMDSASTVMTDISRTRRTKPSSGLPYLFSTVLDSAAEEVSHGGQGMPDFGAEKQDSIGRGEDLVGAVGAAAAGSHEGINEGKMMTMGVLYWQLADAWQGPSWSTIEYDGAWKASHYSVKRGFADAIVTGTFVRRQFERSTAPLALASPVDLFQCHFTNDLQGGFVGTFNVSLYRWDESCNPVASWDGGMSLPGPGSIKIFQEDLAVLQLAAGTDRFIVHMMFEGASIPYTVSSSTASAGEEIHRGENVYYVSTGQAAGQPMTIQDLPETGLTWEPLNAAEAAKDSSPSGKESRTNTRTVRVRVRARAHAAHVLVTLGRTESTTGGHRDQHQRRQRQSFLRTSASDGSFHALPCRAYDVELLETDGGFEDYSADCCHDSLDRSQRCPEDDCRRSQDHDRERSERYYSAVRVVSLREVIAVFDEAPAGHADSPETK